MSPAHVHLLVSVAPNLSLSKLMQYIPVTRQDARFAVTVGNVNEVDMQSYVEDQEMHHKEDNFRISEY